MSGIREIALAKAVGGGGGGDISVESLSVTENGTYTASGGKAYSPVTVNVSGGGDGVPLLTESEWSALTVAQKQAHGLVAIQKASTGFVRGDLVNGAEYIPIGSYLPYSDESAVICAAVPENYNASGTSWGYGTNPIQLSAAGSVQNADGSVGIKTKTDGTLAYVDNGGAGRPFTAYIVAKVTGSSGQFTRELGAMVSRSSGMGMLLFGENTVCVSSWANDTSTGVSATNYFVGVLQFEYSSHAFGAALSSSGDTPIFITKSPTTVGRYITIGRIDIDPSTSNAEPSDMDVLFLGVVSEAESQATVAANMAHLAERFIDGGGA